jgi:hypothetical protein
MKNKVLVNFNMPVQMKDELNEILRIKGYTRTSLILHLLDDWMKSERKEVLIREQRVDSQVYQEHG